MTENRVSFLKVKLFNIKILKRQVFTKKKLSFKIARGELNFFFASDQGQCLGEQLVGTQKRSQGMKELRGDG